MKRMRWMVSGLVDNEDRTEPNLKCKEISVIVCAGTKEIAITAGKAKMERLYPRARGIMGIRAKMIL